MSSQNTQLHAELHSEKEHQQPKNNKVTITSTKLKLVKSYKLLLVINYICLFVGSVSSSLLSKFYFNHKGSSRLVSTWVQSAGFPLLLLPIYLPYYFRRLTSKNYHTIANNDHNNTRKPFVDFTPKILALSIGVGFLLAINNLLFSWGNSYLPVSTSALLLSSQLVFTLILSVLIVKQKITFLNVNCVILLTLSSILLATESNGDRPKGLTKGEYFVGLFSTIGAGLLFSVYLPVMEMIYRKVYCYTMVMEMQFVMELAATALATVGMASAGGFSEMRHESVQRFDLGPTKYWMTVCSNVVTWQLCFMGTAGMVFLTTSLTSGICMTALLAMNVVGGVVVYGDHFKGAKVVSTVLCVWGFTSYVYGMYVKMKKREEEKESDNEKDTEKENEMIEMKNNNNVGGGDDQQEQKHLPMDLCEIVTVQDH